MGTSIYGYDNDKDAAPLQAFGNTTNEFNLVEGFGQGDFVLTGEAALDWTGNFPGGSRLGFQIKAIDAPTLVPAPAALRLMVMSSYPSPSMSSILSVSEVNDAVEPTATS